MFPVTMMTTALVDRLTHHAYILNMNGESYRLKECIGERDSLWKIGTQKTEGEKYK
jgi:hypothetical protein